jgi:hypothetical protein
MPKSNLRPRPVAASPRRPNYFATRAALGPFAVGRDRPCLMFVPKSVESALFGTIWPSGCRFARKSARFAVDTTDFLADFLAS